MKDIADIFGNLPGELFKPKIQGSRKVPVDSTDIDFAIVRFGKQVARPCFVHSFGMEMLTKRKIKALSDQLSGQYCIATKAMNHPGHTGLKFLFQRNQLVPGFHAVYD